MDARSAISVSERTAYIGRVRDLARGVAERYTVLEEGGGKA
jgi:glycyl-tRNA synthetase alpha chain